MDTGLIGLLLFLLQVVVDVGLQGLLLEVLAESGLESRKSALDRPYFKRIFSMPGLLVLGALVGGATLAFWPSRLLSRGPIPGMSLVLAPVGVGGVMHTWGRLRRSRGHVTTNLATFPGGAAFALGIALVRFIWAG